MLKRADNPILEWSKGDAEDYTWLLDDYLASVSDTG